MTARQALLLRAWVDRCCAAPPSYALHIVQGLREAGVEPGELRLELGLLGAEPWTEPMRAQIERDLGLVALNFYGLSEIVSPGVASECPEARNGLHVNEDHFLPEVVDPDGGAPLPLLRYRTGDIASLPHAPCSSGRGRSSSPPLFMPARR